MQKLTVLFLALSLAQSLHFSFSSQPVCISFSGSEQRIHFAYQVMGLSPQNVRIDISQNNGYHIHGFTEPKSSIEFSSNDQYHICLKTTDSTVKEVVMDIWKSAEEQLKQLAKKSDLFEVYRVLAKASEGIRRIAQQEQFQEKRQARHEEILLDNQGTVRKYGIGKLVVMVLVVLAQIVILKRLFSSDSKLNQYAAV